MPIISIKYSAETSIQLSCQMSKYFTITMTGIDPLTAGTDAGRRHTTLQVLTPRPIYSKSVNRVNKINRRYPEYSRFVIG